MTFQDKSRSYQKSPSFTQRTPHDDRSRAAFATIAADKLCEPENCRRCGGGLAR